MTTALLAFVPSAHAQEAVPGSRAGSRAKASSTYTPPAPTPPTPIEKLTGSAYAQALTNLADFPKSGTPNYTAYVWQGVALLSGPTTSPGVPVDISKSNWPSWQIQMMEMWWDGMDGNERDQAKKFNEWMVARLKKDGKPIPGIFRTIENRKS